MAWPTSLSIGLKEWAAVSKALATGRQVVLLRKGGIHEAAGEFEVDHRQFLLFPTYLHQNLAMLKPADREGFESSGAEPAEVRADDAWVRRRAREASLNPARHEGPGRAASDSPLRVRPGLSTCDA